MTIKPIDAFGDRLADIPPILNRLEDTLLHHLINHPETYLGYEHLVVARRFHLDMGLHAKNGWVENPEAQRAVAPLLTRIMTNLVMFRSDDGNSDEAFYGVAQLDEALKPIYDHYASIGLKHLYQCPGQTVLIEGY